MNEFSLCVTNNGMVDVRKQCSDDLMLQTVQYEFKYMKELI